MLVLALTLAAMAVFPSCSSNNNGSPGISCAGATGSFNNTSLGPSGTQYAYELSGWILNGATTAYVPYTEAGYFVVNGNGTITGGFDDAFGGQISGNYAITSNGTGTINLSIASSGTQTLTWGVTLANPGATTTVASFSLIEEDSFANASGAAYQQDTSVVNNAPNGTFVFRTHVLAPSTSLAGSQASIGLMTFDPATGTVAGNDDYNNAGTSGTFTNFAGSFSAPTGTTPGSISFLDALGTRTFDYFVVNANALILYETDTTNGGLGLGRAELQQTPGAYTNASFTGSYVFGSRGDTSANGAGAVNSVGQISTNNTGGITGGTFDWVRDGAAQTGIADGAGTYTLDSSGRVTIQSVSAAPAQTIGLVLYLVSPSRAFILVNNDTSRVEDGTMDLQTTSSFSNSTFSGQYAVAMGGVVSGSLFDRAGTVQPDGNGNLNWAEFANEQSVVNSVCITGGTYTVASNGRLVASVGNLSSNLIVYLISGSGGYVMQGDTGDEMFGGLVNQNQPIPVIPGGF